MEERTYLSGTSLAGMSPTRSRVENDYYATPFEATEAILSREELYGSILEPAAGEGHISKVLREHYPNSQIISTDLVQRDDRFGCGIVGGVDFLTENYPEKFNNVITNPPFSLAKEFAEKALEVSTGKVILFAKIQFLEGRQRKDQSNGVRKTAYRERFYWPVSLPSGMWPRASPNRCLSPPLLPSGKQSSGWQRQASCKKDLPTLSCGLLVRLLFLCW